MKITVQTDVPSGKGKAVVHRVSKAQAKSEQRLIPWTPAPQTAWQKFKRAAVG